MALIAYTFGHQSTQKKKTKARRRRVPAQRMTQPKWRIKKQLISASFVTSSFLYVLLRVKAS